MALLRSRWNMCQTLPSYLSKVKNKTVRHLSDGTVTSQCNHGNKECRCPVENYRQESQFSWQYKCERVPCSCPVTSTASSCGVHSFCSMPHAKQTRSGGSDIGKAILQRIPERRVPLFLHQVRLKTTSSNSDTTSADHSTDPGLQGHAGRNAIAHPEEMTPIPENLKPVSALEIKNYFQRNNLSVSEGYTCYITSCLRHVRKRLKLSEVNKLFVNKTTGGLMCLTKIHIIRLQCITRICLAILYLAMHMYVKHYNDYLMAAVLYTMDATVCML